MTELKTLKDWELKSKIDQEIRIEILRDKLDGKDWYSFNEVLK